MSIETKVLRTFLFAFLGIFLPGIAGIADDIANKGDWSAGRTALLSLVVAAFAAAVRALIAFLPVFKDDDVGVKRV